MTTASIPARTGLETPPEYDQPKPTVRRGANIYFIATVVAQASALLRYVTLARILGPDQLGLAATLVLTSSFFDLVSDTGSDRFLIQDRHGDKPSVQHLVQLVYAGRGALVAVTLALFAIPLAQFYRAPQLAIGFAFLALSPLILGFTHLDNRRAQRHLDFRSEAITIMCCEAAGLLATVAAAILTRSFTAILYGLVTRALVNVTVSHLRAKRPYAMAYVREHAPALARFGGPLMLNGVMLFIGSQGDRVMVARQLGIGALGHYSAVLLLIYYPSAIIMRYMFAMYTPMVASHRDAPMERDRVLDILGGQTLVLAVAMSVGFAIVAPPMVTILYGARFTLSAMTVGLIGILQTARYMIMWPTTGALAAGRSQTVLASNVSRMLAFPLAYLGLRLFGGLDGVLGGFIVGELVSVATALLLLNRNNGLPTLRGFDRYAAFMIVSAIIVAWNIVVARRSAAGALAASLLSVAMLAWMARREWRTLTDAVDLGRRIAAPLLSRLRAPRA
jgi:O-antigen/teichoic acid export membrane protein